MSQILQYLESRITVVEDFRLEYHLIIAFKEIYGVILEPRLLCTT
jgi:hypothetical protein